MFLKSAAYPETVNLENRLLTDLKYLVELIRSKTPPILLVESSQLQYVKYGFGYASGRGFGVTIEVEAVLDIETGT